MSQCPHLQLFPKDELIVPNRSDYCLSAGPSWVCVCVCGLPVEVLSLSAAYVACSCGGSGCGYELAFPVSLHWQMDGEWETTLGFLRWSAEVVRTHLQTVLQSKAACVFNRIKSLCRNIIWTYFPRLTLIAMETLVDSYEMASARLQPVQGGNDPSDSLSHATWVRAVATRATWACAVARPQRYMK